MNSIAAPSATPSSSRQTIEAALRAERNTVAQMTINLAPLIERITPVVQHTLQQLDAVQRYAETHSVCDKLLHALSTGAAKIPDKAFNAIRIHDSQVKFSTRAIWDAVIHASPELRVRQKLLTDVRSGVESKYTTSLKSQINRSQYDLENSLKPLVEALAPFAPETTLARARERIQQFFGREPAPSSSEKNRTIFSNTDHFYDRVLELKTHLSELSTLCRLCAAGEHHKGTVIGLVSQQQIKEAASAHVSLLVSEWEKAALPTSSGAFTDQQKLILKTLSEFETATTHDSQLLDSPLPFPIVSNLFSHFTYEQLGTELEALSDEQRSPFPIDRNLAHRFFRFASAEYISLEQHAEKLASLGVTECREYAVTCSPKMLERKQAIWARLGNDTEWFKDIVAANPKLLSDSYKEFVRFAMKMRCFDATMRAEPWFAPFTPVHNPAAYASRGSIERLFTEVREIQINPEKQLQLKENALYLRLKATLERTPKFTEGVDVAARCLAFGFIETDTSSNGVIRKRTVDIERSIRHRADSDTPQFSKEMISRTLEHLKRLGVLVSRNQGGSSNPYYSVRKEEGFETHWATPYISEINDLNQQYRALSALKQAARTEAARKRPEPAPALEPAPSPVEENKNNGVALAHLRISIERTLGDLDAKLAACEKTLFDQSQNAADIHRYLTTISIGKIYTLHKTNQNFKHIGLAIRTASEEALRRENQKQANKRNAPVVLNQLLERDKKSRTIFQAAVDTATKKHLTPLLSEISNAVAGVRGASLQAYNLMVELSKHEPLSATEAKIHCNLDELFKSSTLTRGRTTSEEIVSYLVGVGRLALAIPKLREGLNGTSIGPENGTNGSSPSHPASHEVTV